MERTGWIENTQVERGEKRFFLWVIVLGLLLVCSGAMPMQGCKSSRTEEQPTSKPESSDSEYSKSLFGEDPESLEEFERIQADFRTGKHASAIRRLQELLRRSPEAPWAEAVEFYLAQAWRLLQRYDDALRQLDVFLNRYPASPLAPRAWMYKGSTYLAMGKQPGASGAGDLTNPLYLKEAREILQRITKNYPNNRMLQAEAVYYLGEVYLALQDTARAKEAFRQVADVYSDTPFPSKALYSLAGLLLSEADVEEAEQVFSEITDQYPKTLRARKARKKLDGLRLVGSHAAPLRIKEWIGEPPAEEDGYQGKLTLLSFWAIWCPHCRRNIPKMERLLEKYATRGVSVLGITQEKEGAGIEKIREYIDSHPMSFPTGVEEDGKTSRDMSVASIPCVVAVDPQGRIGWHGHPDHLSETVIEVLLRRSS